MSRAKTTSKPRVQAVKHRSGVMIMTVAEAERITRLERSRTAAARLRYEHAHFQLATLARAY